MPADGRGAGAVGVVGGIDGGAVTGVLADGAGVGATAGAVGDTVADAVRGAIGDAAAPNVAPVATPLPSRVRVIGLVTPRSPQPRLSNEPLSRAARNVNRLLPTAGSAAGAAVNAACQAPAGDLRVHHARAVRRGVLGEVRPPWQQRLVESGPVEVGLGAAEHTVDLGHRVVGWDERDRRLLAGRRLQFVEGLRRAVRTGIRQVGRRERNAPECRVHERVEQTVVTSVADGCAPGERGGVGGVVLCGLPAGRQQVRRGHVVALILVDHGEAARGRAGIAVTRGANRRDRQRARRDRRVRRPEEGRTVAVGDLPEDRAVQAIDAAALAEGVDPPGGGCSRRPG